ncbi:MAG: tyrosine-type recombinase/integrase [Elusimicrobia bacterium]|nr:tyrosine-type recombinase/integrase [Elusimicrobiota bacterium]
MAIFEKQGVYWIDYYFQGRRKREKVGSSKKLAGEVLHKRKLEIAEGKYFPERQRKRLTFREMGQIYYDSYAVKRRKPIRYLQMIAHLSKIFGDCYLEMITPLMIERYQVQRQSEEVKTSTVNREHACLKAILYKAIQWGYYKPVDGVNPARKVRMLPEPQYRTRFLTDDEIKRLLNCCSERLRVIVSIALNTGMRLGELVGLTWENVDLERGIITLTKTKNNKRREIPINGVARQVLEGLPRDQEKILDFTNFQNEFPDTLKKAGIKDFHFHDLRHTFASHLVAKGVDLYTIQALLGHSSYEVTQRYAHLAPNQKRVAVEVLSSKWTPLWTPTKNEEVSGQVVDSGKVIDLVVKSEIEEGWPSGLRRRS